MTKDTVRVWVAGQWEYDKICPDCKEHFRTQYVNMIFCRKCEGKSSVENFHQRKYPRASLMIDLGEEY
jgi:predicted amidophosphoribosyltransferase